MLLLEKKYEGENQRRREMNLVVAINYTKDKQIDLTIHSIQYLDHMYRQHKEHTLSFPIRVDFDQSDIQRKKLVLLLLGTAPTNNHCIGLRSFLRQHLTLYLCRIFYILFDLIDLGIRPPGIQDTWFVLQR